MKVWEGQTSHFQMFIDKPLRGTMTLFSIATGINHAASIYDTAVLEKSVELHSDYVEGISVHVPTHQLLYKML